MPNLMPLRLAIPLLALLIPAAYANPNSAALKELSDQYVDWQRPGNSTSQARDQSADGYAGRIAEKKRMLDALLAVGEEGLSAEEDIDRRLLIGILRAEVNTGETLRRWENDPSLYLPGSGLGPLLESAALGDAESRKNLMPMLDALPKNFTHGRTNLKRPPERFTRAAIFQAKNKLKALNEGLENLADLSEAELTVARSAQTAFAEYLAFLEEDLLPRSDGSWALGRPAYDFILQQRWHMDSDADRIHRRGLKAYEDTERLAQETAERIQPGMHWTEVFETIMLRDPSAAGLKQAYQEQMDLALVFV